MGWCSGTEIFDDFVGMVIDQDLDDDEKKGLIKRLVVSLENADWDCQGDSEYIDHPLVKSVMVALGHDFYDEDESIIENERNHLAKLLHQVLTEGEITFAHDQKMFLERYESGYYK